MQKQLIYTIGHSTHKLDFFSELLKEYRIDCLIDIRSVAGSRYNPQYNKTSLSAFLQNNGISYLHLAQEFGARHTNPDLLDNNNKVDFEKVRRSEAFKIGIQRVQEESNKGRIITLMCSESDPYDCHRFSMVSLGLVKNGFEVNHILKDKTIKSNAELESMMLKKYSGQLPKADIFTPFVNTDEELIAAYRLRNQDIAFSPYSK